MSSSRTVYFGTSILMPAPSSPKRFSISTLLHCVSMSEIVDSLSTRDDGLKAKSLAEGANALPSAVANALATVGRMGAVVMPSNDPTIELLPSARERLAFRLAFRLPLSEPLRLPLSEPLRLPLSEPFRLPLSEPLSEPFSVDARVVSSSDSGRQAPRN